MATKHKKKPSDQQFKNLNFSKRALLLFAGLFALIGGYFIFKTFAAVPPDGSPPTISNNTAVPSSFSAAGQSVQLTWRVASDATFSCYYDVIDYSETKIYTPSNPATSDSYWTYAYAAQQNATFHWWVSCTNQYGTTVSSVQYVTYSPPQPTPKPVVSLSVSPSTVKQGASATRQWSVSNSPTTCTASGDWSGAKAATGGPESTGALNSVKTYTYTLTCSNSGGSGQAQASVIVSANTQPPPPGGGTPPPSGGGSPTPPKPTVAVVAKPSTVAYNGSTYIQWNSTNATSCSASWTGSKGINGTIKIGPLSQTTSYTVTCSGNGGSATASAKVTVGTKPAGCTNNCPIPPAPAAPTAELEAPPPDTTTDSSTSDQLANPQAELSPQKKNNSGKHLLSLLLGGLLGELINVVKHSGN